MIKLGITSPLRIDPQLTNRRYRSTKHLILTRRCNKSGGSIPPAKVAQLLTAVEIARSQRQRTSVYCSRFQGIHPYLRYDARENLTVLSPEQW